MLRFAPSFGMGYLLNKLIELNILYFTMKDSKTAFLFPNNSYSFVVEEKKKNKTQKQTQVENMIFLYFVFY